MTLVVTLLLLSENVRVVTPRVIPCCSLVTL